MAEPSIQPGPIAASESPVYSIVAPVFNEEGSIEHFYQRVTEAMDTLAEPYEIVIVNDGSRDGSIAELKALHESDHRVRVVDFSRNFGHQVAISAGLDYARGQAVIVIDSDLQDPPEIILQLIARWKDGAEVVYAQRSKRDGGEQRLTHSNTPFGQWPCKIRATDARRSSITAM